MTEIMWIIYIDQTMGILILWIKCKIALYLFRFWTRIVQILLEPLLIAGHRIVVMTYNQKAGFTGKSKYFKCLKNNIQVFKNICTVL